MSSVINILTCILGEVICTGLVLIGEDWTQDITTVWEKNCMTREVLHRVRRDAGRDDSKAVIVVVGKTIIVPRSQLTPLGTVQARGRYKPGARCRVPK